MLDINLIREDPERVKQALLGPRLLDSGVFDRRFIQQIVDQHQSGRRDFSTPIWTLLMFEAFLRNSMDRRQPPVAASAV